MPRIARLLAWTTLVLLAPSVSNAQIGGSGSIQGTVLDSSKAALPGATVTATNTATGIETVRQTTTAGVYALMPLAPGEYRVTVSLEGFQTFVRDAIVVDGLTVVGLNVTLQVGAVKQEVVVTATAPPLATGDARLGQTLRNEVYTALPLVMNTGGPRDPTAFMFLMPGVQSVGRWGNVMGGQDFTTDMYVEGIPITNAVVQGEGRNLSFGISVEAVDQFQVETSGTSVTFNGQGASNYIVKSGTNTFRGSGFEFFRNKALDAKAFFANTKPDDNQHEYGFTFGGPIRKSQMFFFMAYDGYRDRRQTPSVLTSIPTLAQRNGDFSALPVTIYDPRTTRPNPNGTGFVRDPFPNNVIPQDRISSISRYFGSFLPDPTSGGLQNNYLGGSLPIGFNNDNVTGKVDLKLTTKQQASVLFSHGKRSQATPYRGGGNPQTALPLPYTETRLVEEIPTSAQVKHTYVLGARWVNQASLGFSRLSVPIFNATIDEQYPIKAGLRGLPAGEADSSFPEIAFAGPNAPTQWRGTDARAFTEYLNNYTFQNNLNWTHGKHTMTFGLQAQRMDANERERTYGSLATFGFSNVQTAGFGPTGTLLTTTGNAYASFLLGDLNATNIIEDSEVATSGRFYTYAFWAQDDFRLRPNLTLNLGLRYDIMKPYTEVYDRWSFLDADLANPAVGGYPGAVVFAGDGQNSCRLPDPDQDLLRRHRPAARRGLQPQRARRPACGVWHQLFPPRRRRRPRRRAQRNRHARLLGQRQLPEREHASIRSYNWNNGVPSYPAPPFFDPSLNAGFVTGRGTGGGVTYGDPEIGGRPPRYQNWNAGFQYALARTLTFGATYAGSVGDFLGGSGRGFFSNQLDPRFLAARQPADATGHGRQRRRRAGDRARHRPAVSELLGHHRADAAAVSAVLGRDRRLRQRRRIDVSLAPAHRREAPIGRRPDGELQLHVQPDGRQPRGADRLRLRPGLGRRRQRSAARLERDGGLQPAVRRERQAGQRQPDRPGNRQGLAGFRHHAVPIGTSARRDRGSLQPAERRRVLRRFQPELHRRRAHQRQLRRRRRARHEPAVLHRPGGVPVARRVHLREHAADARPRSAQPELLQPGPQRAPGFPDLQGKARARLRRVQPVQQRDLRGHPDEHHERELRQGQLTGQHAEGRAAQGAAGVLTGEQENRRSRENNGKFS